MKAKAIIKLLHEVIEFVEERKSHDCNAYTCHYVKYSEHNYESYEWYVSIIRTLHMTDPDFIDSFPEDIKKDFKDQGLKFAPFDPKDYDNRLKMLNYLIKKYS